MGQGTRKQELRRRRKRKKETLRAKRKETVPARPAAPRKRPARKAAAE